MFLQKTQIHNKWHQAIFTLQFGTTGADQNTAAVHIFTPTLYEAQEFYFFFFFFGHIYSNYPVTDQTSTTLSQVRARLVHTTSEMISFLLEEAWFAHTKTIPENNQTGTANRNNEAKFASLL